MTTREKILKALKNKEMSVVDLYLHIGGNYDDTLSELIELEKEDLVGTKYFGATVKMYIKK